MHSRRRLGRFSCGPPPPPAPRLPLLHLLRLLHLLLLPLLLLRPLWRRLPLLLHPTVWS